jgi:hypothetical protein
MFLYFTVSRADLGSTRSPLRRLWIALYSGVKRSELEPNHPPLSRAEIKNDLVISPFSICKCCTHLSLCRFRSVAMFVILPTQMIFHKMIISIIISIIIFTLNDVSENLLLRRGFFSWSCGPGVDLGSHRNEYQDFHWNQWRSLRRIRHHL